MTIGVSSSTVYRWPTAADAPDSVPAELSDLGAHMLHCNGCRGRWFAALAIVALLDPEVVVIGGGIGSNALLLGCLRDEAERLLPWPVSIQCAELGGRAGLIGAIHHALRWLPEIESRRVSLRLRNGEP